MRVNEIMSAGPACCSPETLITEIAKTMIAQDCGCVPVCESPESHRVVGIVTDRDLVIRALAPCRNIESMTAGDVMSHPVVTALEGDNVADCLVKMEQNQIRRIPIIDQNSQLVGIVSQADIALRGGPAMGEKLLTDVSKASYGHVV